MIYLKIIVFFVVAALLLVAVNVSQIASLIIYPLSKDLYHRLAFLIPGLWVRWFSLALVKYFNFNYEVRGADLRSVGRAIVIANHQSIFDIVVIFWLGTHFNKENNLRWLMKRVLKHIPLFGWGGYLARNLFLHRDWAKDRPYLARKFQDLLTTGQDFWLTFFPEGTRITPDNHRQSQQYCQKKGYPLYERVLLPRSKGFIATVQGLRDDVESLVEVTIHYRNGPPTLADIVSGRTIDIVIHNDIIAIAQLSREEQQLKEWLIARYQQADELLASLAR